MGDLMRFTATVTGGSRDMLIVPLPFDPDEVWGRKARHHVAGTIDGRRMRTVVRDSDGGPALVFTHRWLRDNPVEAGRKVEVVLSPEGPQRADLAPDIAAAFEAAPEAGAFFDSLAQFYRKAYLTWIDATKRRPEERARRIAEAVRLLEAGHKQRP